MRVGLGQRRRDPAGPCGEHHRPRRRSPRRRAPRPAAGGRGSRRHASGARPARASARSSARLAPAGSRRRGTGRTRSRLQERAALRPDPATRRRSPARRGSSTLRRPRSTAPRVRPSPRPRSGTRARRSTASALPMLRRIPTAPSATIRLDPPYETNGSVIPVSGAIASTAARLIAACPQMRTVSPAASSFPNGSRQASAIRKPAQREGRVRADDARPSRRGRAPRRWSRRSCPCAPPAGRRS